MKNSRSPRAGSPWYKEKRTNNFPAVSTFVFVIFSFCTLFAGCDKENTPANDTNSSIEKKPAAPEKIEETEPPIKQVFVSRLAGSWYPADKTVLNNDIENYFQQADTAPMEETIGLILPHAGYRYSGQTAVAALKATDKQYKRIIVIGPSHSMAMPQMLSVPADTHYQTPLGEIPLDVDFIKQLLKFPVFQNIARAHANEHSAQIQLPLLQYTQKDFKLVPIVAGQCSPETIERAAAILNSLIDDGTLVIASSDFTHYGQSYGYVPFTENIPEKLKELDMGAFQYIAEKDSAGFLQYCNRTGATICGRVPIAILLSMLSKDTTANLIKYTTSGELTGDYKLSVSYVSAAFTGSWKPAEKIEPKQTTASLTEEEKKMLLALARKTIIYFLENRKVPTPSQLGITITDSAKPSRAAFVTLHKNSQLRGCIGDIVPVQPLYQSVISNAINAAVKDWRFTPVTISECDDIKIEISALTVPEQVDSPDKIRIGIDGVILKKNGRQAVFLPQVAPEQGWNTEQMLTNLSLKAGLDKDAWKSDAAFLVFQAEVFGEEE